MGIEEIARSVIDFVRENQAWAAPIVFLLAFGESLAFLSLMVPGIAALFGIGALMGVSGISFWPVWFAGGVGAALGDWVSYWIGNKFKDDVARMWPLSRYPDLLPRGNASSAVGGARHLHRPFLRTVASFCAARGRHFRNAVLAFSVRQFHIGFRLVSGAAAVWRRHGAHCRVAVAHGVMAT